MTLWVGNGARVAVVAIKTYPPRLSSNFCLELRDCYCVPNASRNLISVSCLAQDDYEISFNKDHCIIYFENKMVAYGHLINSLYLLHVDTNETVNLSKQTVSTVGSKKSRDKVSLKYIWHLRLDHIGEERINRLMKDDLLESFSDESIPVYESFLQGKMTKLLFIGHRERTTEVLALVHTDMCDPFDVPIWRGYLYFIIFIDDFSWYECIFLMRYKFEAFKKFKEFRCEVEKQIEKSLKILWSDQGGEYLSKIFFWLS